MRRSPGWGVVWFGFCIGALPAQLTGVAGAGQSAPASELAMHLDRDGLPLAADNHARLPQQLLPAAGPVPATALKELASRHRWDRFAADSRLAPVRVTIEPVTAAGRRVGHQVRSAFTLRARLNDVLAANGNAEALGLGQVDSAGSFRELTSEELSWAGIEPAADGSERFVFIQLKLLNRIDLRGVIRLERRLAADSLEVAWAFDHRFDSLPELRTTAARLNANALGEREAGAPEPYAGGGGIVVARQLPRGESAAAGLPVVVVESRLVFSEPNHWFGGSNLLRAKIPLITQEGVRGLRRRLEAAATR